MKKGADVKKALKEIKACAVMETKSLVMTKSCWEDLEDFYVWERLPEVTEFFSIGKDQTMEQVTRKYMADQENPGALQFTIWLKQASESPEQGQEGPRRIGRIVIGDIEEGWKAELWRIYIADTSLRGKGYGREAMEAVMKHCFETLKLERLYLDHYTGNPAAHLYLSLGFQYEGVLRKNCRKDGVLHDVHLMSMLKEEYYSR